MPTLRSILVIGVASVALMGAGATSSLAAPLELDPAATNGGTPSAGFGVLQPLDTTSTAGQVAADYPFFTDNSNTAFTSFLQINSQPVAGTFTTASETGTALLETLSVVAPSKIGATTNITQTYNLYATFSISGTGEWITTNQFAVLSGLSATVTLWASPGNNSTGPNASGLNFFTPAAGQFGVTQGANDFILGTATIAIPQSAGATGTCTATTGCSTTDASISFSSELTFTANPLTTGANGFFVNLTSPFTFSIGAVEGGQALATTETVNASTTTFVTATQAPTPGAFCSGTAGFNGLCPEGGGALHFALAVPEPASLSLFGAGLLGFGIAARRRRRKS